MTSSSAGARQPFWHRFRPGDPTLKIQEPHSSGSGGRNVWLKVTKVFGRSEKPHGPDLDVTTRSTTSNKQQTGGTAFSRDDEFDVCEVVKSKTLPQVHSTVNDDGQRYSPSPSSRRGVHTIRAPCTPPPPVRRPRPGPPPTPPTSSRLAWESLRTPASDVTESPGTPDPPQQPSVAADMLPEAEYLFRRFVDDSTTQETTTETDDVDESSIHDILDGYHSEDNIDDD